MERQEVMTTIWMTNAILVIICLRLHRMLIRARWEYSRITMFQIQRLELQVVVRTRLMMRCKIKKCSKMKSRWTRKSNIRKKWKNVSKISSKASCTTLKMGRKFKLSKHIKNQGKASTSRRKGWTPRTTPTWTTTTTTPRSKHGIKATTTRMTQTISQLARTRFKVKLNSIKARLQRAMKSIRLWSKNE